MLIRVQKIISFIPVLNFFVVLYWSLFCLKRAIAPIRFAKKLFMMFLWLLLITIPRIVLSRVFQSDILDKVTWIISIYLIPVGLSWIAIKDQISYII